MAGKISSVTSIVRRNSEAVVIGSILNDYPDQLPPNLVRLVQAAPESCNDLRHGKILVGVRECIAAGEKVNIVTVGRRPIGVSREYISLLIRDTVPISVAESEAETLLAAYQVRQMKSIFADGTASLEASPDKAQAISFDALNAIERLQKENWRKDDLPEIIDAASFLANPIEQPPELIAGILHLGSKLILGGSSKSYKTWTLLDLGVSVATGVDWLGRSTAQGKVLFVNFEIQPHAWQQRITAITQAKDVALAVGAIQLWNLRGYAADFRKLIPQIIKRCRAESFSLIILDPIYKLYGGTDENAAGDVAELLNSLEKLATTTGAAIAFGAHFAKGNAAGKEAIDRISGSGVFARDPDSLLIFTKHVVEDAFVIEPILRNFAPVKPFAIRWEFPLMRRADDLDPSKLKQVGGRKKEYEPRKLLAAIVGSTTEKPVSVSTWAKAGDIPRQTLSDYLPGMRSKGWVATVGEGGNARQFLTEKGKKFLEASA